MQRTCLRFRGTPIHQVRTKAWYQALEKTGIQDFRWHDRRHTWASWHVRNGTQLFALQKWGGRESSETVRRYASCPLSTLRPMRIAYALCALWRVGSTARLRHSPQNEKELAVANSLNWVARPAGFEPTTPWFVGATNRLGRSRNQRLAAPAVPHGSQALPR